MQTSEKRSTILPVVLGRNNLIEQSPLPKVVSNFLKIRAERGFLMRLSKDITDAAAETKGFGEKKMTVNAGDPHYARVGKNFVSV